MGPGPGKGRGVGQGSSRNRQETRSGHLSQIKNMWAAFPPDVTGMVDYKNICYVITHGDAKDQE